MTRIPIRQMANNLRRALGWRRWGFAIAGVIVLACAQSSLRPPKSKSEAHPIASPATTTPGVGIARLVFGPAAGSKVELRGHSTIGAWTSQSADVLGKVVLDTDSAALNASFDQVEAADPNKENDLQPFQATLALRSPVIAEISVPVSSLHGGSGGMDRDMLKALKVTQHPTIDFVFRGVQQAALSWTAPGRHASLKLRVLGTLNMAGVELPITLDVLVERDPNRHFIAHAQSALLMTDFGVVPPGALFGLIKADDHVLVVFALDFVLATEGAR